ncbi:MAG TPA: hypothetical protein VD772_01650, partial [Anseongella sp.]|nr:hypothetical protein [Anseongella sp.]
NPEERIFFSETDEKRKTSLSYIIENRGEHLTRLTLEFYMQRNPLRQLLFSLREKKKMEAALRESLERLEGVVQKMVLPLEF